eukprot:GHVQ01027095.1.p1 GENE.GHVQ01027095.1~~GHVQ01027095.1.p1  ORF type:complete len:1235 (+),score=168.05 GHVQ01027095.1:334-4038(+)
MYLSQINCALMRRVSRSLTIPTAMPPLAFCVLLLVSSSLTQLTASNPQATPDELLDNQQSTTNQGVSVGYHTPVKIAESDNLLKVRVVSPDQVTQNGSPAEVAKGNKGGGPISGKVKGHAKPGGGGWIFYVSTPGMNTFNIGSDGVVELKVNSKTVTTMYCPIYHLISQSSRVRSKWSAKLMHMDLSPYSTSSGHISLYGTFPRPARLSASPATMPTSVSNLFPSLPYPDLTYLAVDNPKSTDLRVVEPHLLTVELDSRISFPSVFDSSTVESQENRLYGLLTIFAKIHGEGDSGPEGNEDLGVVVYGDQRLYCHKTIVNLGLHYRLGRHVTMSSVNFTVKFYLHHNDSVVVGDDGRPITAESALIVQSPKEVGIHTLDNTHLPQSLSQTSVPPLTSSKAVVQETTSPQLKSKLRSSEAHRQSNGSGGESGGNLMDGYEMFKELVAGQSRQRMESSLSCGDPRSATIIPRHLDQLNKRVTEAIHLSSGGTKSREDAAIRNGPTPPVPASARLLGRVPRGVVRWSTLASALGVPVTADDVLEWRKLKRTKIHRSDDLRYLMPKFSLYVLEDESAGFFDVFLFAPEPEKHVFLSDAEIADEGSKHRDKQNQLGGASARTSVESFSRDSSSSDRVNHHPAHKRTTTIRRKHKSLLRADAQHLFKMAGRGKSHHAASGTQPPTQKGSTHDVLHTNIPEGTGSTPEQLPPLPSRPYVFQGKLRKHSFPRDTVVAWLELRDGATGDSLYNPVEMRCPYAAIPSGPIYAKASEGRTSAGVRSSSLMFEMTIRSLEHGVIGDELKQPLKIKRWVFKHHKVQAQTVQAPTVDSNHGTDTELLGPNGGPKLVDDLVGDLPQKPNAEGGAARKSGKVGRLEVKMDGCGEKMLGLRALDMEYSSFVDVHGERSSTQSDIREFVREKLADSLNMDTADINFCHVKEGSTILAFDPGTDKSTEWENILKSPKSTIHNFFQLDPSYPPTVSRSRLAEMSPDPSPPFTPPHNPQLSSRLDFDDAPLPDWNDLLRHTPGVDQYRVRDADPVVYHPDSPFFTDVPVATTLTPYWVWALIFVVVLFVLVTVTFLMWGWYSSRRRINRKDSEMFEVYPTGPSSLTTRRPGRLTPVLGEGHVGGDRLESGVGAGKGGGWWKAGGLWGKAVRRPAAGEVVSTEAGRAVEGDVTIKRGNRLESGVYSDKSKGKGDNEVHGYGDGYRDLTPRSQLCTEVDEYDEELDVDCSPCGGNCA